MSEPQIGYWVRRRAGKWHLVESVIEDRAVVRCGREMRGWTPSGGELQVSEVMPLTRMIGQPQLCKAGCELSGDTGTARIGFPPEDDGSTAPVDAPDAPDAPDVPS